MSTEQLFSLDCPLHSSECTHTVRDELRLVEHASLDLLDQKALSSFLKLKERDKPLFARYTPVQQMHMLNLSFDGVPTLAAILNFCPYPQGFFPQLVITAVVVPGLQMGDTALSGERFLADERIEGTLQDMYTDSMTFCERVANGVYPLEAIRELILNALIHRDYGTAYESIPIQIQFFNNRLEIHSPGSLFASSGIKELGSTCMDIRNPSIAAIAESLTDAHNRYSGIPMVRSSMKNAGLPEPVFENRENEFVAILYNSNASSSTEDISAFLEFCQTPRSRKEIAEYLGVKTVFYAMQRYVQPLIAQGKLIMTIPDKPKSSHQRYRTVE